MNLIFIRFLVLVYVWSSSSAEPIFQFGGSRNGNNMWNQMYETKRSFLELVRGSFNQRFHNQPMRNVPAFTSLSASNSESNSVSRPAGGSFNLGNLAQLARFYNNIRGNNRQLPGVNVQFSFMTGGDTNRNPNIKSDAGGGLDIGKILAGLNGVGGSGLDLGKIVSGLMDSGVDINKVISMFSGGTGGESGGPGGLDLNSLLSTLNSGQGVDGEVFQKSLNTIATLNTKSRENDPNSAGLRSILSSAGSTDSSSIAARQLPITLLKALSMSDLKKSNDGPGFNDANAIIYSSNKQNTDSTNSPDISEVVFGSRIDTL